MRPPVDDTAITILRQRLPEFEVHYIDLLELYDEDLTPEIVLMELADYVARNLARGNDTGSVERALDAIEAVASSTEDGPELVAYSFLNELPRGSREAARLYFGTVTAWLADEADRAAGPASP